MAVPTEITEGTARIASGRQILRGTIMPYLPFDIETVEHPELADFYFSAEGPYRPSQGTARQKKGESPEDWQKRLELILAANRAEARKKAALYWPTSRVCSVAFRIPRKEIDCIYGEDEKEILEAFGEIVLTYDDLQLIGKNSSTFDVPFLIGRYMAHGMGVPEPLRRIAKFGTLTDVDHMFSRYRHQTYNLETYAVGMGLVDGKMGDGTMVHGWYYHEDGPQWDLIVPYNKQDVEIVVEMLNRYFKPFGAKHTQRRLIQ